MGLYTELNLQTTVNNTPGSRGRALIEDVKSFINGRKPLGRFWNCERANRITNELQYEVALATETENSSIDLCLSVQIKNYDREIQEFLNLLAPAAGEHADEPVYLGSFLSENDYVPTLAWSVEGLLVLKPANEVTPI